MIQLETYPTPDALAAAAAALFAEQARHRISWHGRFSAVLAGGATPAGMYQKLAAPPYRDELPWEAIHLFWGDERAVPTEHPESNFGLAHRTLLDHVPLPAENLHRIKGELPAGEAAEAYSQELREWFSDGQVRFDLVLLGVGTDGHTASLFPGDPILWGRERLVVPVMADYAGRPADRVTLTLQAINAARRVVVMAAGESKAEIVRTVLQGGDEADHLPATMVRPADGELIWLLDRAAGGLLGG